LVSFNVIITCFNHKEPLTAGQINTIKGTVWSWLEGSVHKVNFPKSNQKVRHM
jgi:hypothetical protein